MNIFSYNFLYYPKKKYKSMVSQEFSSVVGSVTTESYYSRWTNPGPQESRWRRFKKYLYDTDTKYVCGRSGISWVKLLAYYILFIIGVTGLFSLILGVTLYMIERSPKPLMPKTKYLVGTPPGFTFIPNKYPDMPLIWYCDKIGSEVHSRAVNEFLNVYDDAVSKNINYYVDCEKEKPAKGEKSCLFKRESLGPCAHPNYSSTSPCIYLKLNKHPKWKPKYYGSLPDHMPEELKTLINTSSDKKKIWVYCEPNKPVDKDHLGKISYYPGQEIMGYYFPFDFQKHYLNPLVAVQINDVKRKCM